MMSSRVCAQILFNFVNQDQIGKVLTTGGKQTCTMLVFLFVGFPLKVYLSAEKKIKMEIMNECNPQLVLNCLERGLICNLCSCWLAEVLVT